LFLDCPEKNTGGWQMESKKLPAARLSGNAPGKSRFEIKAGTARCAVRAGLRRKVESFFIFHSMAVLGNIGPDGASLRARRHGQPERVR
jgi:hypothetical protein